MERPVKTVFFPSSGGFGGKNPPKTSAQQVRHGSPKRFFFVALSSFFEPPLFNFVFTFSPCERHVFYNALGVETFLKVLFGVPQARIL